jgi:hypothetical protein
MSNDYSLLFDGTDDYVSIPHSSNLSLTNFTIETWVNPSQIKGDWQPLINKEDSSIVPDGFFWSEIFKGPHLSVDYHWGKQHLTVQGFRNDPYQLDRFSRWCKIKADIPLPAMLHDLKYYQEWINVEYIGNRVIEIHLRYNDDFTNHNADEIVPVWRGDSMITPPGYSWYHSPAGDRLGFWIKNK